MSRMWDFFENLDEMVYAANIDTYELVYMNRQLRECLGYRYHEEYIGGKCYKILQGKDRPCLFCTNSRLRAGEFVSWVHKNPVLDRRMLLKDTLVHEDGQDYRLEIAINADAEGAAKTPYYYARSETVLNECLQHIFSDANVEESLRRILSYIGSTFDCDRSYIFELADENTAVNTYEWCAPNVTPQIDALQEVPLSAIEWWLSIFVEDGVTIIRELEDIRTVYPEAYAILKPQDIHCLAAGPIKLDGCVIGFIGVDNPDEQMMPIIESFLNVIGYFTASLMRRRDMLQHLSNLSYRDQLTGAYNRHALTELFGQLAVNSIGVIYCDVTGLKRINDEQGHEAGDRMIQHCCDLLRETVDTELVYRTGGDEFVTLYLNCKEPEFLETLQRLRDRIAADEFNMAVGYAWSDESVIDLEHLMKVADQHMYEDKRAYYQKNSGLPGVERRSDNRRLPGRYRDTQTIPLTAFQTFLSSAYCDTESLFQSVSMDNHSSYFYMGDMQSDQFYISDNMRDAFGFPSNLVKGLIPIWAERISTPEYRQLYWQDINSMLAEKRTIHDLRYRVRDVNGDNQWIRCYGILKWNKDKTKPLFFSGRITHQDERFVVDPVTGFLREHGAFQQLEELRKNGGKAMVIGFCLNGITEINSTRGRAYGDRLLRRMANALVENLSDRLSFYRLEGVRCMALTQPGCAQEEVGQLVREIRQMAHGCYEDMGITVQNVCSFGVIEYPNGDMSSDDLVENLSSLIRVARQETKQEYVDFSLRNIQRIRRMSNMALRLSEDVVHDMEHFRIVIQPVVRASEGRAIGGEVLLRWQFEGHDVSPMQFIPLLEKDGLIQQVGRWVFEQVVRACARLRQHNPDFYLTFNVSLHQLSDPMFLPFMRDTLEQYQLDGGGLVAELTESALDEQPEELTRFVRECQKMGLSIALDDFGSGYSSLRMLLQYPMSIIKLDQSLVREVTESEAKMNFIRSIVFACHQFGKTVCMEGVEHASQNEIILNTGCDLIQGYFYYRPMELQDVYHLVGGGGGPARGAQMDAVDKR